MKRVSIPVLVALVIGGCASMSEDECRVADWFEVGLRDGRDGQPDGRLARHAESCARAGVAPDGEAWRLGRQEGLLGYCTAESGWRNGRSGRTYQDVCEISLEPDFLYGYEIGHELHQLVQRIQILDSRIVSLDEQLGEEDLDEERRRELRQELSRVQREIRDLERQRGDAEAEARNRGFREIYP